MKLFPVSLCILLVCLGITGHPVSRHRINRARSPFRQIATATPKPVVTNPPKPVATDPLEQDVDTPDVSGWYEWSVNLDSVGMDSEAQNEGTRPMAAMTKRRKSDCKSRSEDRSSSSSSSSHSHSHSHSHSSHSRDGSESRNSEDWLENVREYCGADFQMLNQMEEVSPHDVRNVMTSVDDVAKQIANTFSQHRDDIAHLEANMEGQSADSLVASHVDLLNRFHSLLHSAMNDGKCELASMKVLLNKIAKHGSVDFADSRCNRAYQMARQFDMQDGDMDSAGRITLVWLSSFGEALRSDMYCIIKDIEALSEKVTAVRNLAETDQNPSIRDINIGLATAMAYVGILENELDQFNEATDIVGKALQDVNLQELEAAAMSTRKRDRLIAAMKSLLQKA